NQLPLESRFRQSHIQKYNQSTQAKFYFHGHSNTCKASSEFCELRSIFLRQDETTMAKPCRLSTRIALSYNPIVQSRRIFHGRGSRFWHGGISVSVCVPFPTNPQYWRPPNYPFLHLPL